VSIAYAEILSQTPREMKSKGVTCTFIRINETQGIKVYTDPDYCQDSYKDQKRAAKLGLAPNVGEKFKFYDNEIDGYRHGYVTDCIVETWQDRWLRNNGKDGLSESDKNYITAYESGASDEYYSDQEVEALNKALYKNGFDTASSDLHWKNCGWLPDGRLVCIDFIC
jgi:hypothetical protein